MTEWRPVMPFVGVESVDGPYDDQAYVAGFQAGQLAGMLDLGSKSVDMLAYMPNVAQLDLIAMRKGLVLHFEDVGDGWAQVSVREPDLASGALSG